MNQTSIETSFLERNKKLVLASFVTILLMVIAGFPHIGYEATTDVAARGVIRGVGGTSSESSIATARLWNGTLQVSFNPLLYPLSYLSGRITVIRKYSGASEFWDYEGQAVAEAASIGTVFVEFVKNLPYFLAAGFLITLALVRVNKFTETLRKAKRLNSKSLLGFSA